MLATQEVNGALDLLLSGDRLDCEDCSVLCVQEFEDYAVRQSGDDPGGAFTEAMSSTMPRSLRVQARGQEGE